MTQLDLPWWAQPGADVTTAAVVDDDLTLHCPECGVRHEKASITLYFHGQTGRLLGFVPSCGHTVDGDEYELAVIPDEKIHEGFFATAADAGTYPVTVRADSGNVDIIPVKIAPEGRRGETP